MLKKLRGRKTIATGLIALCGIAAAWFGNEISDYEAAMSAVGVVMGIFMRTGINSLAKRPVIIHQEKGEIDDAR